MKNQAIHQMSAAFNFHHCLQSLISYAEFSTLLSAVMSQPFCLLKRWKFVLRSKELNTLEQNYIGKYSRTLLKTAALEYKIQYKYTDVIKTSRKTIAPVQFRKPGSLQRRRIKKKSL